MTTRYIAPSVEAIQEDSEDGLMDGLRGNDNELLDERSFRQPRSSMDGVKAPTRANSGRERRRKHRSKEGGSKHQLKSQGKNASAKRASGPPIRDSGSDSQRIRHRRTYSNRSASSTSSSEDEEGPVQDHREVLAAARLKLTSPSMISTFTSLTSSTNKSSGSSGSNSTVTQASMTKRSSLGKRPEIPEGPMSPAVPDPPNVFAFLENGSTVTLPKADAVKDDELEEEDDDDDEAVEDEPEDEQGNDDEVESQWPSNELPGSYNTSILPHQSPENGTVSTSSSVSSSFHGSDHSSERAAENDTDRSTSPERSVKDHVSDHESDPIHQAPPTDRASARMASQIAAAQQRQNLYGSMQNFGTPNMPRGSTPPPHTPSTALSPRYSQHMKKHSLPRAEKLPVTGYELLATKLSSYNSSADFEDETTIKPLYRKFGALNHRLLLHLQDELSELEEQLHRLDNADTQSRRAGLGGRVVPASRRAAAMQGGDLQWHKTDVLGRIGFKLAQYNQALSSFNTTQSLAPPAPTDVETYREYLSTEHPIAEAETHFLDPTDDLISICSSIPPYSAPVSNQSSSQPLSRSESQMSAAPPKCDSTILTSQYESQSQLQGLAVAIAVAVLVPIMTFNVIPGFIGRMTVVSLVAGGVVFALMQAGVVGKGCFGKEGLVCGTIYGGVMVVIAGILL